MHSDPQLVIINGRFLGRAITGVERYGREMLAALDALVPHLPFRFEIFAPLGQYDAPPLANIPVKQVGGQRHGQAWEQIDLPWHCGSRPLVNFCNLGPLAKSEQITVIHDTAVFAMPETFSFAFRTYYRVLLPAVARRSRRVVTVSDFSRQAIARHLKIDAATMPVISPAVDQFRHVSADVRILDKHGLRGARFVLTAGSMNPRKNLKTLIAAAAQLPDVRIVAAGGSNSRVFASQGFELPANFLALGYVTDEELKALYEAAACFVFPSLYEGFGIPPLEAMTCGCCVIAANAGALPETCGDAALYADPNRPEDFAAKIRQALDDPALRETLQRKGQARAELFKWSAGAERWLELLAQTFPAKTASAQATANKAKQKTPFGAT